MLLTAFFLLSSLVTPAHYDARTIIQRSVQANRADWEAAPDYEYFESDQQSGGTKTYEEVMILGSPYERLVAVNDKPLTPEQQVDEQRKLDEVTAQREHESRRQRELRIAKYEQDRKRDHLLMVELTKAFDFISLGKQKLGPYNVYVLQATPRADYRPPNLEAQVLTGMRGTLWVDSDTFQWVKVEAEVIRPVSIEGFLARVEPGTRFELEKMPVTDRVWLPKHFVMKSHAKIFFLFNRNSQEEDTYFGYRRRIHSVTDSLHSGL